MLNTLIGIPVNTTGLIEPVKVGISAAINAIDPNATIAVEMKPHPYYDGRMVAHFSVTVLGHTQEIRLLASRKFRGRFSHAYSEHPAIETDLGGHMRNMTELKAGGFNYTRIAEGLADASRQATRRIESVQQHAVNRSSNAELIAKFDALPGVYARTTDRPEKPIHIQFRLDGDFNAEKATKIFDLISGIVNA